MIPLSWAAVATGVALAVGALSGWGLAARLHAGEVARAQAEATRRVEDIRTRLDAKSADYEALRAKANVSRERGVNTIREVYREVQVPAECAPPAAAVGVLDAAVAAANAAATGEPGRAVRGAERAADAAARP